MHLLNATNMTAGYTLGIDKTGRESVVVVVKGTFTLPLDGSAPEFSDTQKPLVEADESTGEPGFSATLYESDYAPIKHHCDVLLNGSAYAPDGSPTRSVAVGLKVSTVTKSMKVIGNRTWKVGVLGTFPSKPEPFMKMPISYDVAFGGLDDFHEDENKRSAYMDNPVGRGYHRNLELELVLNTPLPNTEEDHRPVSKPTGDYKTMAFGPIGRGWPQRSKHAGTYDQNWIDEVFPFLPANFDERYYQAAPEDQQCELLRGGETVYLVNLTQSGRTVFEIPTIDMPVVFFRKRQDDVHCNAAIDTLTIEPDEGIFSLVWRANLPLRRDIFEVSQILVGKKSRGWWRAQDSGSSYFPSIAAMIQRDEDE